MERLVALRPALLDLHRELLAVERADMERFQDRMTGAEFLQIATDSLRLAWLAPLLELIVEIDEALEAQGRDPADAPTPADLDALVDRVRALVAPPDAETPFGRRYGTMLQRNPGVVMTHSALVQRLGRRP
jgi:hypothetical protein